MIDTDATLARMARREAAAAFLVSDVMLRAPWAQFDVRTLEPGAPALEVHVVTCRECGGGPGTPDRYLRGLPFWFAPSDLRIVPAGAAAVGDLRLTILGCETLPVRSFLLVAAAARAAGPEQVVIHSRSAAWQESAGPGDDLGDRVAFLDAAERWADLLLPCTAAAADRSTRPDAPWVLPSSTRLGDGPGRGLGVAAARFASPHPVEGPEGAAERLYTTARLDEATRLLRSELAASADGAHPGLRETS